MKTADALLNGQMDELADAAQVLSALLNDTLSVRCRRGSVQRKDCLAASVSVTLCHHEIRMSSTAYTCGCALLGQQSVTVRLKR